MSSYGLLTHYEIIKRAGGPAKVARALGVNIETVKQWSKTNSISAAYWWAIANQRLSTLEELAVGRALHEREKSDA